MYKTFNTSNRTAPLHLHKATIYLYEFLIFNTFMVTKKCVYFFYNKILHNNWYYIPEIIVWYCFESRGQRITLLFINTFYFLLSQLIQKYLNFNICVQSLNALSH